MRYNIDEEMPRDKSQERRVVDHGDPFTQHFEHQRSHNEWKYKQLLDSINKSDNK